jgi:hypothetical protein
MRLKYDFFWIAREELVARLQPFFRISLGETKETSGHDILCLFRITQNTCCCTLRHFNNVQTFIMLIIVNGKTHVTQYFNLFSIVLCLF